MRRIRIEHAVVFIAAIILINILFLKPIIGVADNGDFGRIMGSTGLKYIAQDNKERYFEFVNRLYQTVPPFTHYSGYFSSEIPMVLAARLINSLIFYGSRLFDIRCLAFIYSIIFLPAIYLLIKYNKKSSLYINFLLAILILLIFTDAGYISYFNSFYGEAVSFVSLLSVIGFAFCLSAKERPGCKVLIGFFLSAIILTGAKLQNAPVGAVLIIFGIGLVRLRKDLIWKRIIAVSCIALVSVMTASYLTVPKNIRVCNKYQSVFFGILKDSPSPDKDLQELGINEDLAVLAGTNYFMRKYPIDAKNPVISQEISTKINPAKVAVFYIKHPVRYIKKLNITAENGFKLIQGFGNYERSREVTSKKVVSAFRYWSDFKMKVLPHSLVLLAVLFISYYMVLLFYYRKSKDKHHRLYLEVFMLAGAIGFTQFVIPVICDGEADLSKHLFLFNACFDIMFIAAVSWSFYIISKFIKSNYCRFKYKRMEVEDD